MVKSSSQYDVIVIGGGPAGLMAAISAQTEGARTLLIEKGNRLGRKLGISGGGRCNVTNAKPLDELMQNIPGNGRFMHSALHRFSNTDVRAFFEGLGIRLKEEDRGRVFPVTDKAATVVQALIDNVFQVGVEIWEESPVSKLLYEQGEIECNPRRVTGVLLKSGATIHAGAVVVATGGCSVPKTGSTGDAYPWAKEVGHTIVSPYPTEVPLTSKDWFIRERTLQGISLRGTTISIYGPKGKRLTTEVGDLLFTHVGLSGPAALRCSHYVSTARRREPSCALHAEINVVPEKDKEELRRELQLAKKNEGKKFLRNVVLRYVPERMADVLLRETNLLTELPIGDAKDAHLDELARLASAFRVNITGTLPLEQATVTGGGISVKEIDPRTMGSKICTGLFFAGEVMDVHAHTGGYNITVAFSSGHLAGASAAEFAKTLQ